MATSLVTFMSIRITASTSSRKSTTRSRSSHTGWLTSIFGWSTDPEDYIDSRRSSSSSGSSSSSISSPDATAVQSGDVSRGEKHRPGGFTEEKARQLRMMTSGLEMSHEKMYHSAISSRLASDFSHRILNDVSSN